MKYILFFLLFTPLAYAQIGIGTSAPHPGAVLDLTSPNKGLLLPRVKDAATVTVAKDGMMVFDIASNCIKIFQNGVWSSCISGANLTVSCTGFKGSYCTTALSGTTYEVTIKNNDMASRQITPAITDLTLSGMAGVSVTAVSPNVTTTINGDDDLVVTYTISGTPAAVGTLTGIYNKQGLSCFNTTPVTIASSMTVTPLSPTTTLCVNTPLATITQTTTGVTAMGTPSGLPPGVTAVFSNNTITISGTPTVVQVFDYSIPLTGIGCGTIAGGRITVTAPSMTVTPASSSPSLCVNTPLPTAITHTTANVTALGTAIGLPAGLTPSRSGNTITINGTPTVAGTFAYSIPLVGSGCPINATGTITVFPAMTVTAASASPTLCVNTVLWPAITHTTTIATGIGSPTGLPTGVTATWSNNTITISGTPAVAGTFRYAIPLTGSVCGSGSIFARGTITVTPNLIVSNKSIDHAVVNIALPPVNITVINATTMGTPSGLPPGISAALSIAENRITLSGTPTALGTFNYVIPVNGSCFLEEVKGVLMVGKCGAKVSSGTYKIFLCHNLGADTSLDPHIPVMGLHGAHIQWGKRGPNLTGNSVIDWMAASNDVLNGFAAAPTALDPNASVLPGWSQTAAADNSWSDNIKTANDPCPAGFRVPTSLEWQAVVNFNTRSNTTSNSWNTGIAVYGNALHFGPDVSTRALTLPANGSRSNTDSQLVRGAWCHYWSSTMSGSDSFVSFLNQTGGSIASYKRIYGMGIRCIAE